MPVIRRGGAAARLFGAGRLGCCTRVGLDSAPQMRDSEEQQEAHAGGGDAVEGEAVHAERRDEEDGEQRAEAEATVAADAEDAHALAARALRDAIDAAGSLWMEDGGRDAHDRDRSEDQPVVGDEARDGQRGAGKEDADGHEPLARALVGQIAEQRLNDGAQERRSKHQARDGRVVHAVEAYEERQQRRQRTRVDVIAQMRRSEQVEVFLIQRIKSFRGSVVLLYHTSAGLHFVKCVLGATCASFPCSSMIQ